MFDYAAPKEFPPSSSSSSSSSRRGGGHRRGVGQHPHRGFETVTIAFQGEVQHRDSTGNTGIIGPGDCQWMTAARGIIHEEFHSEEFTQRGGVFEMCQLWVNLPKQYKMSPAKYQGILDGDIPRVPLLDEKERDDLQEGVCKEEKSEQGHANDGYVRVIAGSFRGEKGPAETFTPINMWDIILPNGQDKVFELEVEKGHTTLLFVRRGEVKIQNKTLGLADVAIMTREGTKITVESLAKDTSLLVLSGEPIDEPIAARGPFVMNTHQELMEAMQDYNMGRNGFHHF
jgi:Pirin-related protein